MAIPSTLISTTLVERVRAISGSKTSETASKDVVSFLVSGATFTVNNLPQKVLWHFSKSSTNITSSTGYDIDNDNILSVSRNGFECVEVPIEMKYAYASSVGGSPINSLHAASSLFPVYYKDKGKIFIKPDPIATEAGEIQYIPIPSTITTSSRSWEISTFDQAAIKYAASLDSKALANYWTRRATSNTSSIIALVDTEITNFKNELAQFNSAIMVPISSTEAADALTKAKTLIDSFGTNDVEDYILAEDTEMIISIVQTAAQEVNRAGAEIQRQLLFVKEFDSISRYEIESYLAQVQGASAYLKAAELHLAKLQLSEEYMKRAEFFLANGNRFLEEAMMEIKDIAKTKLGIFTNDIAGSNGASGEQGASPDQGAN